MGCYRSLLAIASLLAAVHTCLAQADRPANLSELRRFVHQGERRTYRVYVPTVKRGTRMGAVLLLHGYGGSADQILGLDGRQAPYTAWLPIADRENLVLIVPNGNAGTDGKQGWNDARGVSGNPKSNDVDFLNHLVASLAKYHPIDSSRVYASGTSNGGHMSLRLAAETPEKFAAVAAIAAANPDPIFAKKPRRPVSVMLINGTHDRLLPFRGGRMVKNRGRVQSMQATVDYWIKHNHCGNTASLFQYPDKTTDDRCTASRRTFQNPKTGVEVSAVQIDGGGHAEPSIKQPYGRLFLVIVGRQNQDIEMADEVWKFFKNKSASH